MAIDCLVADAGHTRIKLAHCRREEGVSLPEVLGEQAVIYGRPIDWDAVRSWFGETGIERAIVTGTNRSRAIELVETWPSIVTAPVFVDRKQDLPIRIDVDFPEKVGIDRLLNGVAANAIREADQPAVVVDTGTAITVDAVDRNGTFVGGTILPGILLWAKSLHEETTTLPHVNVWELLKTEPAVLGKNTEAAIASGLYWGHLGVVRELIDRLAGQLTATSETEHSVKPLILLTGGASGILAPYLKEGRLETALSLQGLALAAEHLHWRSNG